MRKFNQFMSLLLITGLFAATNVFAAENYQPSNPGMSSGEHHVIKAEQLIGKTVKNKQNEDLGKVEDVVIGEDGRADFVVLERGGLLGAGAKYVPLPYNTFMSNATNIAKIDTDSDLILNFEKSKLDSAPTFSDKHWDMASNRGKICSFYGHGAC